MASSKDTLISLGNKPNLDHRLHWRSSPKRVPFETFHVSCVKRLCFHTGEMGLQDLGLKYSGK